MFPTIQDVTHFSLKTGSVYMWVSQVTSITVLDLDIGIHRSMWKLISCIIGKVAIDLL